MMFNANSRKFACHDSSKILDKLMRIRVKHWPETETTAISSQLELTLMPQSLVQKMEVYHTLLFEPNGMFSISDL